MAAIRVACVLLCCFIIGYGIGKLVIFMNGTSPENEFKSTAAVCYVNNMQSMSFSNLTNVLISPTGEALLLEAPEFNAVYRLREGETCAIDGKLLHLGQGELGDKEEE